MRRNIWIALVLCIVFLVSLFALAAPALADTLSLTNNTPGTADGSTLSRAVTVNIGDLPIGSTLSNVKVAIDFNKIDDGEPPSGCGATPGGDPWNEEMFFYLTSPAGTRVVLVESAGNGGGTTYSTGWEYNGPYLVVFDDDAPSIAGPAPLSGTFRPEQPLSGFDGESPFGSWTLTAGDDRVQDPLCFASFALELSTPDVPESITDLVLDKTGPATSVAGEPIDYTIVVTNNGPESTPACPAAPSSATRRALLPNSIPIPMPATATTPRCKLKPTWASRSRRSRARSAWGLTACTRSR